MNFKQFILIICIVSLFIGIFSISSNAELKGNNSNIKEETIILSAEFMKNNKQLLNNKNVVASINGEMLYEGELEFKKELYEINDKLNFKEDYKTPFNQLAKEKFEQYYAKKYNLLVTDEEINAEIDNEKKIIYNGEKSTKDIVSTYISKLGMTENEYWNKYRPIELRKYFTHLKVQDHILKEAFKTKKLEKKISKTQDDINNYMNYINKYYKENIKVEFKAKDYVDIIN